MELVVYSHTDVNYVLNYWFTQTEKYLSEFSKTVFINNKEHIPSKYNTLQYDDSKTYKERVLSCLEKLDNEKVILFQHEDMFLYDSPDIIELNKFSQLVQDEKVFLVKLLRNRSDLVSTPYSNLYLNSSDMFFSIQPTIIKVKNLKEIYSRAKGSTIWEFETNAMNLVFPGTSPSVFAYRSGNKRGKQHWDSDIYPYLATAVVKGQWNYNEYSKELNDIL